MNLEPNCDLNALHVALVQQRESYINFSHILRNSGFVMIVMGFFLSFIWLIAVAAFVGYIACKSAIAKVEKEISFVESKLHLVVDIDNSDMC